MSCDGFHFHAVLTAGARVCGVTFCSAVEDARYTRVCYPSQISLNRRIRAFSAPRLYLHEPGVELNLDRAVRGRGVGHGAAVDEHILVAVREFGHGRHRRAHEAQHLLKLGGGK